MTADDFEDRLRGAMTAGVTAAGEPDLDRGGLVVRADRRRRRQRRVGVAAAVLVVAALTAGWSLRGADDAPVEQVTATTEATPRASEGAGVVVAEAPLPEVERPEDTYLSLPRMSYGPTGSIFLRTLDDGTILSLRGNTFLPASEVDPYVDRSDIPPWWERPESCVGVGDLRVEAVLPDVIGHTWAERVQAVAPGSVVATVALVGASTQDRRPAWLAIAQAPPGTAEVRATFPGGETDAMAPVDGLAVLVAPVAAGTDVGEGDGVDDTTTFVAVDAVGQPVGDVAVTWVAPTSSSVVGTDTAADRDVDPCAPPTTLPPPGSEQPADPASAEAGVRATWEAAFGRPTETPTGDLFDDPTGLGDAEAAFREQQGGDVLDGVTVPVDGVVFADAETAYVEYTVDVPTLDIVYDHRFAVLVLEDGTWKVTRESVCALLAIGTGPVCPPL